MIIETVVLLRLAAPAPALSVWTPVLPALSSTLLSAPAVPATSLSPAPVPFSAAPLDLSRAAGVYERRGVGLLVLDAKDDGAASRRGAAARTP